MIIPCYLCAKKIKSVKNYIKHCTNHIVDGSYDKAMCNGTEENKKYVFNMRMFKGVFVPPEIGLKERSDVKLKALRVMLVNKYD